MTETATSNLNQHLAVSGIASVAIEALKGLTDLD